MNYKSYGAWDGSVPLSPHRLLSILFITLFLLSANTACIASIYQWNGSASSDWNNMLNWTPAIGVPGKADQVTINPGIFEPKLDRSREVRSLIMNNGNLDLNTFTLYILNFAKFNGAAVNNGAIEITGDEAIFNTAIINAEITVKTNSFSLSNSDFKDKTFFEATGDYPCWNDGGNIFRAQTTIVSGGAGGMILAGKYADNFYSDIYFINSGAGMMNISFSGNTATAFRGDIYLSSIGDSRGICFSEGGGECVLAEGKTVSIAPKGFSKGMLSFRNFIQSGCTKQKLTGFSGTSECKFEEGTVFNGELLCVAPGISLNGGVFNDAVEFVKTGSLYSWCFGGNIFNAPARIINKGQEDWRLEGFEKDIFNADITFVNCGSAKLELAYNDTSGTRFNGNVFVNSSGMSKGISFCDGTGRAILTPGKKISVGNGGYSSGSLTLNHFMQCGEILSTENIFKITARKKVDMNEFKLGLMAY
jgi:hypothetical protein